jgi:hypothetical protein
MENSIFNQNMLLIDGNYTESKYWDEKITEGEGSFSEKDVFITFNSNESNINITFNLYVSAKIETSIGDYHTPTFTDIHVDNVSIDIISIEIDEEELEITKELRDFFNNKIKLTFE